MSDETLSADIGERCGVEIRYEEQMFNLPPADFFNYNLTNV